jgi:hypothetical protein
VTLRDITAAEWLTLRRFRGMKMTGFTCHTVPFDGPLRGYYYWPYGGQPDEELIDKIMARCPLKAAERFLVYFEPASGKHHEDRGFAEPKPKRDTPAWMHQATYA